MLIKVSQKKEKTNYLKVYANTIWIMRKRESCLVCLQRPKLLEMNWIHIVSLLAIVFKFKSSNDFKILETFSWMIQKKKTLFVRIFTESRIIFESIFILNQCGFNRLIINMGLDLMYFESHWTILHIKRAKENVE